MTSQGGCQTRSGQVKGHAGSPFQTSRRILAAGPGRPLPRCPPAPLADAGEAEGPGVQIPSAPRLYAGKTPVLRSGEPEFDLRAAAKCSSSVVCIEPCDRRQPVGPPGSAPIILVFFRHDSSLHATRRLRERRRAALAGAGSPRLVLVREPDQLGVERAHPQLAFGVRLVELAEPNPHVAAYDDRTPASLDDDH